MCEGMKLLNELSTRMKNNVVRCNPGGSCWCMQLHGRVSGDFTDGQCLSPSELLSCHSACFNEQDKSYLVALSGREWSPSE